MTYWLFKSEPSKWSWAMQKAKGAEGEEWSGVRNYQARNFMRAMALHDKGFFYHSNQGLEIVGIVEICATSHPDSTSCDARWDCVNIRALCDMPLPVSLKAIKTNPLLTDMALVKAQRLSVQPVRPAEWAEICRMGGLSSLL
ncbi:EVE domain-containing protein [Bartonella sp. DGB2]|uniref:EVE domain-containing protein n=1 Tax=Bartonella sp. DGB2 TaxID=3388426 RepID=UPI00398FBD5D